MRRRSSMNTFFFSGVATAAKKVYIRGPADNWDSHKAKREAIGRVKTIITSETMKISKELVLYLWVVSPLVPVVCCHCGYRNGIGNVT